MKRKVFIGVFAAIMLVAFTACENQVPTYKVPVSMTAETSKTEYLVGETLDPSSITATVYFSDGSSSEYPGNMVGATAEKLSAKGTKSVDLEFGAGSATSSKGLAKTSLTVNVYDVESITLGNLPTTAAWDDKEDKAVIDQTGITATVAYNYGKGTRTLTSDEFKLEFDALTVGAEDAAVTVNSLTLFGGTTNYAASPNDVLAEYTWEVDVADKAAGEFSDDFTLADGTFVVKFYHEDGTEVAGTDATVYIGETLTWKVFVQEKESTTVKAERELAEEEYYFTGATPAAKIEMTPELYEAQQDSSDTTYAIWVVGVTTSASNDVDFIVPDATDYVEDVKATVDLQDGAKESLKALAGKGSVETDNLNTYFKFMVYLASDPKTAVEWDGTTVGFSVVLPDDKVPADKYDPVFYITYGMPGNEEGPLPYRLTGGAITFTE